MVVSGGQQRDSVVHMHVSGLPWWLSGKESTCQVEDLGIPSQGWEDALEEEMATHSSILA